MKYRLKNRSLPGAIDVEYSLLLSEQDSTYRCVYGAYLIKDPTVFNYVVLDPKSLEEVEDDDGEIVDR